MKLLFLDGDADFSSGAIKGEAAPKSKKKH